MGAFLPRFVSHVLHTHYKIVTFNFLFWNNISQKLSFSQYQNVYKSTKNCNFPDSRNL